MNVAIVREKSNIMKGELAQGKNPKAEKKEGITVGEFFLVYMDRHGANKKSSAKDQSQFDRLLKSWQNYRLVDITRSKVEALHKTIGKETPTQANRVLALLSIMFSMATLWGYLKTENPCGGDQEVQGSESGQVSFRRRAWPVL
ncbi:MAG: hypothetical protein ACYDBP_11285 [Leptospirales bacterium]